MIKKLNQHVVFRYIVSGGTSAMVTLATLYTLNSIFHMYYLLASSLSFCVGFVFSFVLQKFWTFKNNSTEKLHHQVALYLSSSLFGLLFNTALMYVFVDIFNFMVVLSQVFAGAIVACFTFFISRWVFMIRSNE